MRPHKYTWLVLSGWIMIVFSCPHFAQSMIRYSINAGSGQFYHEQMYLSASLGQSGLIGTKQVDELTLTIGFQQMESKLATSIPWRYEGIEMQIFPNPFYEAFSILFSSEESIVLNYRILDSDGKTILTNKAAIFSKGGYPIRVTVNDVSPGMIFLDIEVQRLTGEVSRYTLPIVLIQ